MGYLPFNAGAAIHGPAHEQKLVERILSERHRITNATEPFSPELVRSRCMDRLISYAISPFPTRPADSIDGADDAVEESFSLR